MRYAFLNNIIFYLCFSSFHLSNNESFHQLLPLRGGGLVSKTHPSQGIDFAMGIQSGSGNLGVFLAFISSGYLAQSFNWKVPLFVWAGVALFLGSISFLVVRKTSTRGDEVHKPDFSSWMETLKNIKIYIPGFVFGGACWGTTVFYAPSLLNHRFQIPLGQTGLYLALWIGVGTVMTYFFGFLSRHLGRLKISVSAFIGATFFLFILGIAPVKELALVSLFFFGAFLFLVYPSFQSFVGDEVSPKNQTQAFSLVANAQMITGAIVVLAAGFLSDRFGINSPFLLVGVLGAVISVFYLFKRPVLAKKQRFTG